MVFCFLAILFYRSELMNGKWLWRSKDNREGKFSDKRFCPEVFNFLKYILGTFYLNLNKNNFARIEYF